jgi:hypothetical protein
MVAMTPPPVSSVKQASKGMHMNTFSTAELIAILHLLGRGYEMLEVQNIGASGPLAVFADPSGDALEVAESALRLDRAAIVREIADRLVR